MKERVRLVLGSVFLVLLIATAGSLRAQEQTEDWSGTGILALRAAGGTEEGSEEQAALGNAIHLGTDIRMEIQGMTNRVQVHQRFSNNSSHWVEGVYTFPLPEDSAVNSVRVVLSERELIAVIQEKAEARRQYDEARQAGKKAALTEQQRPNMFTQSVANIAPGETVDVYIQYLQPVKYDSGQFSVRYPMTVTPRFSPGTPVHTLDDYSNQRITTDLNGWAMPTSRVPDADRISPHYLPQGHLPQGQNNLATLNLILAAGLPVALVESTSHEISIQEDASNPYTLNIGFAEGSEVMNRDFEIVWQLATGQAPLAASFTETVTGCESGDGEDARYVQLMMVPPQQAPSANTQPVNRELVIVLDTSGSMAGESIRAAKLGVGKALDALNPDDYFNLIEFNTNHRALFRQAVPANADNLLRARNFVSRLQADGGTNMAPALFEALQSSATDEVQGRVRQLVFITDGSVGNEREIFQLIHDKLGKSRLFTVGIGSAPNSYFMTRAAEQGRGSFVYIADVSRVESSMATLFNKLENPVITELAVQWPAGIQVEQYPAVVPDLYAGEPVVVTAKITGRLPQNAVVTLSGKSGSVPWTRDLTVAPASGEAKSSVLVSGIAAAWGRLKIADLMSSSFMGASHEEVREGVIEVSIAYQLLSQFTSFIAVEQVISRPQDLPLMGAHVPLDVPKGQQLAALMAGQGQGVKVVMPATANGLTGHLLLGLLALFCAAVLLMVNRSRGMQRCN